MRLDPRHPTGIDRGEQRHTTNVLNVRFVGETKLKLVSAGDRLHLISSTPESCGGIV